MKPFLMFVFALFAMPVHAGMYKCTNGSVVSYQSSPCQDGNETVLEENAKDKAEAGAGEQVKKGVTVGPIYVKAEEYSNEYQYYSVKVYVQNQSEIEREVSLHYKGVDREGFQVEDFYLSGRIPPKQARTLTDRKITKIVAFERIYKWELDK